VRLPLPPTRLAGLAGAVVLLALAVWGGEYSTGDWLTMRRQLGDERDNVAALRVEVDSLAKAAKDLETNPAVQERVAREEFGMIRDGEVLYRVVPR
jgi:cell division protein FtsB